MAKFNVTYEIVTQESAENGDTDESGFICKGAKLRDAISEFTGTRTNAVDSGNGLEDTGDWLAHYNGMEFETGAYETRHFHFPRNITQSSRNRIVRLLRA